MERPVMESESFGSDHAAAAMMEMHTAWTRTVQSLAIGISDDQDNAPTLDAMVQQALQVLDTCPKSMNDRRAAEIATKAWLQPALTLPPSSSSSPSQQPSTSQTLRHIQLQVQLRLAMWSKWGSTLLSVYRRRKKKRGNKNIKTSQQTALFDDILVILSSAAFRLPRSQSFSTFLQSTLDRKWHDAPANMPSDTISRIFAHFEVKNPHVEDMQADESAWELLQQSRRRAAKNKNAATKPSSTDTTALDTKPKAPIQPADSILPASVSLKAPLRTKNALLLKSNRSRFVGSHFNANLSSVSTLFRQVKVKTAAPVAAASRSAPLPPHSILKQRSSASTSPLPRKRNRSAVVAETPAVAETPLVKKKQRPSVAETPRTNLADDWQQQSSASLVAQAFRAVRRR